MAAFQAQVLDVRAGRLGHPQPVEGEQEDQDVLGGRAEPCGDQEGADEGIALSSSVTTPG